VEVGGDAVGDQVLLGEHDAAPEPLQVAEVERRDDLERAVRDVVGADGVRRLVGEQPLDAELVEHGARVGPDRARDAHAQLDAAVARQRRDELERQHLRPRDERAERGAVDGHRELAQREPPGRQ
jgi:hypothetical protein